MIIRYSQRDKDEINRVIKPLEEEHRDLLSQLLSLPEDHFTVIDGLTKPTSEEANDLIRRENECRERLWKASNDLYNSIEDRRFNSLSSRQRIIADAHTQTDAIIEHLIKALKLAERDVKDPLQIQKDIAPLTKIWNAKIIRSIQASGGDTTKLDASLIIDLIKKDLHRHYGKLNSQDKKELTEYITHTVKDAIAKYPEIENSKYWIVTKDSVFSTIGTLAVKKNKLNKGAKKAHLKIGNVKYSFDKETYKEITKHIGKNAVNLYIAANHEFTMNPNNKNEVSFPTIPFLELCGKEKAIQNPKSLATEIERIRYGELASLRSMAISLDRRDRDNLPDLYDQNLFESTRINKDRITLTFAPKYADYLRAIKTRGYIPQDILYGSGRQLNALAIKFKLWDNATLYNNVLSGQGKIISVRSLLKETSLPTIEDLGMYRSRWTERIKERFEEALKEVFNSDLFTEWHYCKGKSQELTPQEKRDAERDYYIWEALYISYDIKDRMFKTVLVENAEKNKEKRKEASERRKRREIIASAKAIEKLEKAKDKGI